jgi:hypothetical protein
VEKVLTQKLLKKEEGKESLKRPPPPVPPPPQGDQPQPKGLPEGKKKKKRAVVDGQIVEYEIKYIELNSQSIVDSWNEREWIGGVPNQTSFIKIKYLLQTHLFLPSLLMIVAIIRLLIVRYIQFRIPQVLEKFFIIMKIVIL